MLDVLRKRKRSWVIVFLVGIIVVVFALWGVGSYINDPRGASVATINGEALTPREFELHYQRLLENYRNVFRDALTEEMIRNLLYNGLSEVGYKIELAENGTEAIEKYAKAEKSGEQFDAVILDLTIPGGMGGKETIEKLLEIDPNLKAIASSGYANDTVMANFKRYGFSGVLAKDIGHQVAHAERRIDPSGDIGTTLGERVVRHAIFVDGCVHQDAGLHIVCG